MDEKTPFLWVSPGERNGVFPRQLLHHAPTDEKNPVSLGSCLGLAKRDKVQVICAILGRLHITGSSPHP